MNVVILPKILRVGKRVRTTFEARIESIAFAFLLGATLTLCLSIYPILDQYIRLGIIDDEILAPYKQTGILAIQIFTVYLCIILMQTIYTVIQNFKKSSD